MAKHKPVRVTGKHAKLFKDEEKRFGREVAIYNVGFLAGDDNGYARGFKKAVKLMASGPKNRRFWDNRERRLAAAALKKRKR